MAFDDGFRLASYAATAMIAFELITPASFASAISQRYGPPPLLSAAPDARHERRQAVAVFGYQLLVEG